MLRPFLLATMLSAAGVAATMTTGWKCSWIHSFASIFFANHVSS